MKRGELVRRVAEQAEVVFGGRVPLNITKAVLEGFFMVCDEELRKSDGMIPVGKLGKLVVHSRPPRWARNPFTGERMWVGSRKTVKFKVGNAFYRSLNPKEEAPPT